MQQWKRGALSAALVALAACGGSGGSSGGGLNTGPTGPPVTGGGNPNVVTLINQQFAPATLTVSKGVTVTWNWNDCAGSDGYGSGGCVTHGVVFDDGSGLVSPVQSSGVWTRIFSDTGTFNYHCSVHLTAMTGIIKVQ